MPEEQLSFQVRDFRDCHWFRIQDEALDLFGPLIGGDAFAVYCAIVRYGDRSARRSRVSLKTLAYITGYSQGHVKRQIAILEEWDLIMVARVRGRLNIYWIPEPPWHLVESRLPESLPRKQKSTVGSQRAQSELPESSEWAPQEPHTRQIDSVVDGSISQQQTVSSTEPPASLPKLARPVFEILVQYGISKDTALDLARSASREQVEGWIRYAENPKNRIHNRQGFVVDRLGKGEQPPKREEDRRRYVQGEYGNLIEH